MIPLPSQSACPTLCREMTKPNDVTAACKDKMLQQPRRRNSTTLRHTVSFDDGASVYRDIPSRHELSETDKRCLWFQQYEYNQIRNNNKILCRRMKHREPEDDTIYCYRGLEHKASSDITQRRRTIKSTAALAVYSEQMKQDELGIFNPDLIRNAYQLYTAGCHAQAHQAALQDARAVRMDNDDISDSSGEYEEEVDHPAAPEEKKVKTHHHRPTPYALPVLAQAVSV